MIFHSNYEKMGRMMLHTLLGWKWGVLIPVGQTPNSTITAIIKDSQDALLSWQMVGQQGMSQF